MTGLQQWLAGRPAATRTLRAAFSLLLVLVLVAGGPACAATAPHGGATTAVAVETAIGRPAEITGPSSRIECAGAAHARGASGRLLPRWLDLRSGGLAAARAPDAVAAPRQRR